MLLLTPADDLAPLAAALAAGSAVLLPTDTVYGLASAAADEAACERMLLLKTRDLSKPTSVIAGSLEGLFGEVLPGLDERIAERVRRLLPGAVTLVVPNPAERFHWLCGPDSSRIGVRVPELLPSIATAIDRAGAIATTSANLAGARDPAALEEVPGQILEGVAVAVDAGRMGAGVPSTVIDVTADEPVILRAGALTEAQVRAILLD